MAALQHARAWPWQQAVQGLFIFCSYSANPCGRGLAARYTHVIHKAFPTDWGQLVHRTEPFQRVVVGGYLGGDGARLSNMPPAAVCPRFLHRVIHRIISTLQVHAEILKAWGNHPQRGYEQKMIKSLQGLILKGLSDMPPCFPQAAPHYPWKRVGLWKQWLAKEYGCVSGEGNDKFSTLRRGLHCSPCIQLSARPDKRYALPH